MKYIFHKKDFDRRFVYSRGILIARKWNNCGSIKKNPS